MKKRVRANSQGYMYVMCKEHPRATSKGYVLEHLLVVEKALGRYIQPNENVHHKNGIKDDNRLENLEVMTRREHSRLHGYKKEKVQVLLKCPFCGILFYRPTRLTHLSSCSRGGGSKRLYTACSRQCNGRLQANVKWGHIGKEDYSIRIKANIIAIGTF
jgi:hypothetical protein